MTKRRADHEAGYVLHTYPYKETSLIVEAFTRAFGRVALLARGARRPRSAMRGVLLSFQPLATVRKWKEDVAAGGNPRDTKVEFAKEIVARFHGAAAAQAAERAFEQRFRHGQIPEDLPEFKFEAPAGGLALAQVLKLAGLAPSTSEAQRLIEQGGVRINGNAVSDRALRLSAGEPFVLQAGKRKAARIRIS